MVKIYRTPPIKNPGYANGGIGKFDGMVELKINW